MGCWDNGYGGITCDGSADTVDEWVEKKFGRFDGGDDKKNAEILDKILKSKQMFLELYNLAGKNYMYQEGVKYTPKDLIMMKFMGKTPEPEREPGWVNMSMQEFCQTLRFCLPCDKYDKVPIPSFVNGNPDQGSAKPSRVKTTSAPPAATTPHKAGELHTLLGIPKDTKIPFTFLDAITKAKVGTTVTNPTQIGKSKVKITGIIKEKSETALFWKRNQKKRTSGRR